MVFPAAVAPEELGGAPHFHTYHKVLVCIYCMHHHRQPGGHSRVNGDGPSSAKMVNSAAYQSHNYESFVLDAAMVIA